MIPTAFGVIGIAAVVQVLPASAAENDASFYLLGGRGPMAGVLPPPGVYFQNDVYFYDGTLGAGKSLSSGGRVVADVKGQVRADFPTGTWVLPWDVLGGNVAMGAILPFGRVRSSAGIELDTSRFGAFGRSLSDQATVIGDPVLSAALGWHDGNLHWNVTTLLNVPVGDYREGELANLAFHRWAGDMSGALTWFNPKLGIDLSTAVGITFNGENPATDYRTGTEFHIEWAASKMLTKQLSIGLVGFHYQQLTGDSGSGDLIGPNEGRVTALGGTAAYNFEVYKRPISARLSVYREFATQNRLQGTAGLFLVALPLSSGR